MIRKAFTLEVYPDKIAEYIKRHDEIWPEMVEMLHDHGVSNYSIYLGTDGKTLFGYAEISSEERWEAIAQTEVCQRWWVYMQDIMVTNPDNSPVSHPLQEMFFMA